MNTWQFMDKQIMDLSKSPNNDKRKDDLINLVNLSRQEDNHSHVDGGGAVTDEMLPNYDFQPIRPLPSSQLSNFDSKNAAGVKVKSSDDCKANSCTRNYGLADSAVPTKVNTHDHDVYHAALISEIDRTMKKHADNLVGVLEGVCVRLSELENKTHQLESSVDDLKALVGNNHGSTDGKLRQIKNVIREVQTGVQVVKDKHEILEAQLQLSKVQISKGKQQSEAWEPGYKERMHRVAVDAALQSLHQIPPSAHTPSLPPTLRSSPPSPTPLNLVSPIQYSNNFSHNITSIPQHDSYYQPSGQTPEAPPQPPPQQQPQVAPPSLQVPSPHIQFSQPSPLHQQHPSLSSANPTQSQPPVVHHAPYLHFPNFLPSTQQAGVVSPPSQNFNGNPSQGFEPSLSRLGSGFSSQYGSSTGHGEPSHYAGSPSQFGGGLPVKSQPHSSSNMSPGGGSGYQPIPTAKILPHASGSGVGGGSSNGGIKVPVDDVVDKVTSMGFPRDEVRATVGKLTENGQAVDLNVVLDKLMTDGVESQGPRAWFGR